MSDHEVARGILETLLLNRTRERDHLRGLLSKCLSAMRVSPKRTNLHNIAKLHELKERSREALRSIKWRPHGRS